MRAPMAFLISPFLTNLSAVLILFLISSSFSSALLLLPQIYLVVCLYPDPNGYLSYYLLVTLDCEHATKMKNMKKNQKKK